MAAASRSPAALGESVTANNCACSRCNTSSSTTTPPLNTPTAPAPSTGPDPAAPAAGTRPQLKKLIGLRGRSGSQTNPCSNQIIRFAAPDGCRAPSSHRFSVPSGTPNIAAKCPREQPNFRRNTRISPRHSSPVGASAVAIRAATLPDSVANGVPSAANPHCFLNRFTGISAFILRPTVPQPRKTRHPALTEDPQFSPKPFLCPVDRTRPACPRRRPGDARFPPCRFWNTCPHQQNRLAKYPAAHPGRQIPQTPADISTPPTTPRTHHPRALWFSPRSARRLLTAPRIRRVWAGNTRINQLCAAPELGKITREYPIASASFHAEIAIANGGRSYCGEPGFRFDIGGRFVFKWRK